MYFIKINPLFSQPQTTTQKKNKKKKKKKKTRDFLMDPLLYFSITSQARFFPGAIRPPRADAPPFTCSTCQLTERAAPSAGN